MNREYLLSRYEMFSCFKAVFEIISLASNLQSFITKINGLLLLKWHSKISGQRFYVTEVASLIAISKRDLNTG